MSGLRNIAPVPLSGECVYSIVAAFAHRWFRGKRQGGVLLFGGAAPCTRDVPARLPELASNLPGALGLTAEQLAMQHTTLPIHFPFLEAERRTHLLDDAVAGKSMQLRLGMAPSRIVCARSLRLCPYCMEQDKARDGRAYWHREHQLAGALVCPWHDAPLVTTSVRPESLHGQVAFVAPAQAKLLGHECLRGRERLNASRISRELSSLLDPRLPLPGPARLQRYYRQRLIDAGYCQTNHSISLHRLRTDLVAFYGPTLLRRIACTIPLYYGWLAALVRTPRGHAQPLRHVLLMVFLGTPAADALNAALAFQPACRKRHDHPHRITNPQRLNALRPVKRRAWLQARYARTDHSALYAWLWRNDRAWLHQHRQPISHRVADAEKWAQRDARLADLVPRIANRIRVARPWRRVSRSAIASGCGTASWLVQDHPHLPKAVAAIKAATESAAAFAVRRLNALASDPRFHAAPSWKLRAKAGISVSVAKQQLVARALLALTTGPAHELR